MPQLDGVYELGHIADEKVHIPANNGLCDTKISYPYSE